MNPSLKIDDTTWSWKVYNNRLLVVARFNTVSSYLDYLLSKHAESYKTDEIGVIWDVPYGTKVPTIIKGLVLDHLNLSSS